MSAKKDQKIIIVRKKKAGHGGHHGGSWKVAYADFVTAMMAFFLVMWIMGMDSNVKDLVQGYFNNPVGFKKRYSGGENILSAGNAPVNSDIRRMAMLIRDYQKRRFEEAKAEIERRLEEEPGLQALKGQVDIVVTREGLRIELIETGAGETFFEKSSSQLKPAAADAFGIIGEELSRLPNMIMIEGHTDAANYGSGSYTNWELSVDRANAARRAMLQRGLDARHIGEVRGYADRHLRVPEDPYNAANRRVSILVPFQEVNGMDPEPLAPPAAGPAL